jgi:hypothetical protein
MLVPAACLLLGLCFASCGGERRGTNPRRGLVSGTSITAGGRGKATPAAKLPALELIGPDPDRDSDSYNGEHDNEYELLGRPAGERDARAIAAVVRRYYAAAAHGDGAGACRLIYSTLAESIAQDYGQAPGPAYLRGSRTCAAVMSRIFARTRRQLSAKWRTLEMGAIRVDLNLGSAQLGFRPNSPDRYLLMHRERGAWKLDMLFDVGYPVGVA